MAENLEIKNGSGALKTIGAFLKNSVLYPIQAKFNLEIVKGNIESHTVVQKFGAGSVGTTLIPVTQTGNIFMPTSAVTLELLSDDSNDNANGSGAREVTIQGLDANWDKVTIVIATDASDGTTPAEITTDLIRLNTWRVSKSGSYANATTASHQGELTIREKATPANIWDTMGIDPIAFGRSQLGVYSIPRNTTAYVENKRVYTDISGNKFIDVYFFKRENADSVSAPYDGVMELIEREIGVQGGYEYRISPKKVVGPADVGFMAKASTGTASISVEFDIVEVAD